MNSSFKAAIGHRVVACLVLAAVANGASAAPTTGPSGNAVVDGTCAELIDGVRQASGPLEEAASCVSAARCILVERCAEPLSRLLHGRGDRRGVLASEAAEAKRLLDEAARALADVELDDEALGEMLDCIEQLLAFAEMFAALAEHAETTEETSRQHLIDGCVGLSLYLDDPRAGVVEAARLWQGAAYRRAGRPDRALHVLRPVLATPKSPRIGLLARVERCRALADRDEHVAALALCLRLERRVGSWFDEDDEETRRQAVDAVRFLRVELLKQWAEKLRADGHEARAVEVEGDAKRVLGEDDWPVKLDRRLGLGASVTDLPECEEALTTPITAADSDEDDEEPDEDDADETREPAEPLDPSEEDAAEEPDES